MEKKTEAVHRMVRNGLAVAFFSLHLQLEFMYGVSKNADLAHYFLPDVWLLEKLSKMPVMNGPQDIMRGSKNG